MFHGWMFDPDGDHAAADSTRSSTSLDTGASLNARTDRRLVTASYTSMTAYLSPAIAMPVVIHSGTNTTSLGAHRWDMARHRACSKWGHPREGTCALPRDPSSQWIIGRSAAPRGGKLHSIWFMGEAVSRIPAC